MAHIHQHNDRAAAPCVNRLREILSSMINNGKRVIRILESVQVSENYGTW